MNLKNILAENMLRFGLKNLTEANKRNILLEQKPFTGYVGGKYKLDPPSKVSPEEFSLPSGWTMYRNDELEKIYKSLETPVAIAWLKRNPTFTNWLSNNPDNKQYNDGFYARALFELSMLERDKQNNEKWREKQLTTPDPAYAGIASKIVGMIMKALGGADDEQGILTALQMIRKNGGLPVYGNMLQLVKTSPNVKKQFKRNFNTVTDMIYNGGVQAPGYDKDQAAGRSHPLSGLGLGITDEEWTRKYAAILKYYNPDEGYFNQPASY